MTAQVFLPRHYTPESFLLPPRVVITLTFRLRGRLPTRRLSTTAFFHYHPPYSSSSPTSIMSLLAPLRYLTTSIASTSRLPVLSFSRTLTTTQNPSSPRQPHDLSAQLDRRNKTADIAGNAILSAFVGIDVEGIAIGGSKAKKMRESLASVTDSSSVSDFLSPTSSSSLLTSSTSSLLSSSLEQPGYSPTSIPPKEDPILNLLTNLLMKHGNKEGARKIVVESLREL